MKDDEKLVIPPDGVVSSDILYKNNPYLFADGLPVMYKGQQVKVNDLKKDVEYEVKLNILKNQLDLVIPKKKKNRVTNGTIRLK